MDPGFIYVSDIHSGKKRLTKRNSVAISTIIKIKYIFAENDGNISSHRQI